MIRHIVLLKLKPGYSWEDPLALEAEKLVRALGNEVPEIQTWYAARNLSDRPIAYDFVVMGTFLDEAAVERYLTNDFHRKSTALWRRISDWVVVDAAEDTATVFPRH